MTVGFVIHTTVDTHCAYSLWISLLKIPCVNVMSAKQAINDKLQGSVATYLRCGGVINN